MDVAKVGQALLQSAADAVVATDREGLITFWNPGAARIFGFSADEAVGQSLDIIIPENQRPRHWEGYRRVMETGQSRYGEGETLSVPALSKGGGRLSIEFTIVPLKDGTGAMLGMASVLRDVTARFNEMRELRRKAAG